MSLYQSDLKGGCYYKTTTPYARVGVWHGVTYADGGVELHDLETGRPFKVKVTELMKVPRTPSEAKPKSPVYTVESGRWIMKDGVDFITIFKADTTKPVEADEGTRRLDSQ